MTKTEDKSVAVIQVPCCAYDAARSTVAYAMFRELLLQVLSAGKAAAA
jgi:hypothetical protein